MCTPAEKKDGGGPRVWTCVGCYKPERMLGSGSGGMRGRNGRVCRVQNVPSQNTLKRELRTGVRKPVILTKHPYYGLNVDFVASTSGTQRA